ncbi:MAG TPA: hypothetical protein VGD69_19970 [Herpetosiphonaceae bacterium]
MRCLFIVHNAVSYYYIKRYMDVIERHFPDARIGLCVDRNDQFVDAMAQLASIPIPPLTLDEALTQPWDIAFFAAHGGAHRLPDTTCKIHIQHGLGYGKRVLGDNYTYGPVWTMRDERCIYDLFFEASHTEALRVEQAFPHLAGRLCVIGSLTADDLLATRPSPQAYGITCESRVVLLMSTWGPTSLWQYLCTAPDSIDLFHGFTERDVILISLHPHLITHPATSHYLERLAARGLRVHWTYDEDEAHRFMQLAQVGLSDNTSLALYYCLLRKPLYTVASHWHSVGVTYDPSVLQTALSRVPALDRLEQAFVPENQQLAQQAIGALAPDILSYPRQAEQRLVHTIAALAETITQGSGYGRY